MRFALLVFFLVFTVQSAKADDLEQLVDFSITPAERGQVYERLTKASFPAIAAPLARLIQFHSYAFNPPVMEAQPWLNPKLNTEQRVATTLRKLWRAQIESAKTPGQNMEILLNLLDDKSLGIARCLPASEVYDCLDKATTQPDPALPGLDMILRRIDRLAADDQLPTTFAGELYQILYAFGDPNAYVDRIIARCAREENLLEQENMTLLAFQRDRSAVLTDANRRKYVRHCVRILRESEADGTGSAYCVAMQLGEFVGVRPQNPDRKPFLADFHDPRYEGKRTLWQLDTVKNALRWWSEHKAEFEEPAPK